ncbi:hypothetical protein [Massilia endophytica]|uniref:hypothetical protein n=1 Tax=Massilia endophytica TaxID=2899220 RepID=UPI001E29ABCA|nr:hypothetical protein [Massilia endophytica]UGQ46276.1 hypothetical protein LSQ66_21315 [Massilia endophytica]
MKTHLPAKGEPKTTVPPHPAAQLQKAPEGADRRPAAVVQRQLRDIANGSRRASQLGAMSALVNHGSAPMQGAGVAQLQGKGERALQYGMLGATMGSRAGVYGALAGGAIGAAYGYLSGTSAPPTFSNHHKDQYQSELSVYEGWRSRLPDGLSAYQSGAFYRYSSSTAAVIHSMLCEGKLMYTYDTEDQLKVSGNHGNIKHALLAGGQDVYAAGTVDLDHPEKNRLVTAIDAAKMRVENEGNMIGLRDELQREQFQAEVQKAQGILLSMGFRPDVGLDDLVGRYNNLAVRKADAHLEVTEDSGHYSPSYDSGHKAVEAWRNAGYKKISWKPRWTKRKWMGSVVQDVNE